MVLLTGFAFYLVSLYVHNKILFCRYKGTSYKFNNKIFDVI